MKTLVFLCVLCVLSLAAAQKQLKIKEPQTKLVVPRTTTYYNQVLHLRNTPGRCLCKTILGIYNRIAAYGIYSASAPGVDSRAVTLVFNMAPLAFMIDLGIDETFKDIYARYQDPNGYIRGIVDKISTHAKQARIRQHSTVTILYSADMHRMALWINGSVKEEVENCERRLITVEQPANLKGQVVTVCTAVFEHFVTALNYD